MDTFLAEKNGVLEITLGGTVTKNEILELWQLLVAYAHFPGALVRARECTWETPAAAIQELAWKAERLPPIRWAFIADDAVSFGMFRMFSTLAEKKGIFQVFRTEESARAWLGVGEG